LQPNWELMLYKVRDMQTRLIEWNGKKFFNKFGKDKIY
jgi:hypothetical protein